MKQRPPRWLLAPGLVEVSAAMLVLLLKSLQFPNFSLNHEGSARHNDGGGPKSSHSVPQHHRRCGEVSGSRKML